MWPWATEAPPPGTNDTLITVAGGIITALIVGAFGLAGLLAKGRNGNGNGDGRAAAETSHAERLAVLEHRADQGDETKDAADRLAAGQGDILDDHEERITDLEHWRDREDPGWRRP